jgi:hypothetical protein
MGLLIAFFDYLPKIYSVGELPVSLQKALRSFGFCVFFRKDQPRRHKRGRDPDISEMFNSVKFCRHGPSPK